MTAGVFVNLHLNNCSITGKSIGRNEFYSDVVYKLKHFIKESVCAEIACAWVS